MCLSAVQRDVTVEVALQCLRSSEFDPSLEGDHTGGAIAPEADAEQSRRWRDGAGERPESGLSSGVAGRACLIGGKRKVGMV